MKGWIAALAVLAPIVVTAQTLPRIDNVRVDKSEARLYLLRGSSGSLRSPRGSDQCN
jgi:hypothetical protein